MRKSKEKEAKTTTTKDSLITVIITAASIIAFIGGYVLSSGLTTKNFYSINYNDDKDDEIVASDAPLTKDLSFNENNIYDRDYNLHYKVTFPKYVIDENNYLTVEYGNSNYEVVVKNVKGNELLYEYKLEFDSKINDIEILLETEKNAILYLLEDGSIEYTLIDDLLENDFLRTNGRINEATDVVKFVNGTSCNKSTQQCKDVIYAQSSSGMIYDINEMI